MTKTEKMTERVTVKMDANLKAKLQREAERCGEDMLYPSCISECLSARFFLDRLQINLSQSGF